MKKSVGFILIAGLILILLVISESLSILGTIVIFLILIIVGVIWFNIEKRQERLRIITQLEEELSQINTFVSSKKLIDIWGLIAIDNDSKQIALKNASIEKIKVYPYSSIMSCEIIEDGETIYRKSNTLGRAVVGGVIAGGVGAVIGGLTAQGKQDKEIKTIDLKILIRDSEQLGFNIRFFDAWEVTSNTKQSVKLSESVYGTICKQAIKQLEEWKDTMDIIIDSTNSNDNINMSVTDELFKLNELKEKGVLTEKEFQIQKTKILK